MENTFKLTVDNLEENVVHYWTVVPVYKNIYGTCLSGIWSFEINETYLQTFDISLDVNETERSINWGSMWSGYLELSNHGNGVELIEFTMYAGALEGLVNVTVGTFLLQPFETMNMTINITIPDGFPVRSYNIILQALSKVSKQRETFVLIINTVGTEEYYKGFETYDAPSDGKPGDDTLLSEEIPILMRNILLIGFALVITVALTILLIVRHSINRANERAIVKLKYLIARRRKEIIEARKAEQAKSAAAPLPVPQPVGQPAVPPKPAAAAPPATQPALQPTPEQPAPHQPPIAQQAPPAQPEQPATDAGSAEQPMAVTAPSEPAAPQPGKQPPGGTNEGG